MRVAVLHRRLTAGMALAGLLAYVAGAGWEPTTALATAALAASVVRLPPGAWGPALERVARVGIVALCAWAFYVAFALRGDFMPAVVAMLLFLLVSEALRPLDARNEARLYLLSGALAVAGTAFYPGVGFAAAFVAFVVLATLALMTGHLRREGERFGGAEVTVGPGVLFTTAALSGITLLIAAALFVVFPRLPRQWNVQGRPAAGAVMAGFGDRVTLGEVGGRIESNPQTAFRVEFPDGRPADPASTYWRGRSFDRFDGRTWSRSPGVAGAEPGPGWYADRWGGPGRSARIFGAPPGADVLFGEHPVLAVEARSAVRPLRTLTGDVAFTGSDAPVYSVLSAAPFPPAERLLAGVGADPPTFAPYLQLPRLDPRLRRLADSLGAGHAERLERVRAVERFLDDGFAYTLDLPRTAAEATVEGFLFQRRAGHCEYFASAMVVLLRAQGIPARNVTGFLGGEWNRFGDYLAVTGNNAHAWVEVWFPGAGWVPFDPTPSARTAAVAAGTGTGWTWPAALWLGGVEHRWYRWVLDYNLDKQLGLFREAEGLLRRSAAPAERERLRTELPGWLFALVGTVAAGVVLWRLPLRAGARVRPETRHYLALRRAYARAGFAPPGGPLDFLSELRRRGAPGAEAAADLVRLYVRARFAGEEVGDTGRERMRMALAEVRGALRRARRQRPGKAPPQAVG